MLDDLDERRLEQSLKELEEFKAKIELKKKKKNCLDVLEEIHEMVEGQLQDVRKERDEAIDDRREAAEEPPTPRVKKTRWATKYGKKYHYEEFCKGFNGHKSFEWKPCEACLSKTEKTLNLTEQGSSSSTEPAKDDTLGFEVHGQHYHDKGCTVYKGLRKGTTDDKEMCQICRRDEGILDYVRAAYTTPKGKDK